MRTHRKALVGQRRRQPVFAPAQRRLDQREVQHVALRVTAAEATIDPSRIHSLTRPNVVSVGTIVWLSSELMFFAGLFAMYFSIQAAAPAMYEEGYHHLEIPYALVFTVILVASSITCQLGVFAAERGDVY